MPRRRPRPSLRTCAIAGVLAVGASACRVDVAVDLAVEADGSGSLSVAVTADAEVVEAAGDLAGDLRVDDLAAAGWEVTPPVATSAGGLRVVLRRDVADAAELPMLLDPLDGDGGPLHDAAVSREVSGSTVRSTLTGTARVEGGLAAFGDAELLAALGAIPYADDLDARRLTPTDALGITLRARLPGTIERTGGTVAGDGSVTWQIPVDGSAVDLRTVASGALPAGGGWGVAAAVLRALFVGWIALAAVLVLAPAARRRRARRRRAAPASLGPSGAHRGSSDDDPGGDAGDGPGGGPGGGAGGEPPRRPTFPLPNR